MSYIYKKENIMGQMKQLLDNIFELELDESQYPDDLQMDYELWLLEKQQKELILQDFNFQTHE
jgi:hypothetical protein